MLNAETERYLCERCARRLAIVQRNISPTGHGMPNHQHITREMTHLECVHPLAILVKVVHQMHIACDGCLKRDRFCHLGTIEFGLSGAVPRIGGCWGPAGGLVVLGQSACTFFSPFFAFIAK